MKYLKINNSQGFYINKDKEEIAIDRISSEDIYYILDRIINEEDFEFDEFNEDLLKNQVHKIIYKEIEAKVSKFVREKDQIKKEIDELYKEEFDKYKIV